MRLVGVFQEGMPRVEVTLYGVRGVVTVECILDTAFNGDLTLPPSVLQELGVIPSTRIRNRLASGGEEYAAAGVVQVEWMGTLRYAEAIAYRNNALLGTALLDDCHIDIEATEGGEVIVEPL